MTAVRSIAPPVTGYAEPPGRRRSRMPSRWTATVGPALLVAAGYVDPGNWGTDAAAGAQYGYRLVWVLAAAILAALFLQHLAARVGYATGRDLATLLRLHVRRATLRLLMPPLFLALAVTETVELLGVVFGVRMLTGWSWLPVVGVSAGLVFAVLAAPGPTARRVVYGCLGLVAAVYLAALVGHGAGDVVLHLRPAPLPDGSAPVAVGLIGSIVMPHNILLQSALARDSVATDPWTRESSPLRASLISTAVTLTLAFAVNAAILSLARGADHTSAGGSAHGLSALNAGLGSAFGPFATVVFGLTLLASGLASSTTGALISVDVLARLVPRLELPLLARRALFLVPATVIAASPLSPLTVLVWSQLVLTWTLPVVLIPLVWFAARTDLMGSRVLRRGHLIAAAGVTTLILAAGCWGVLAA